MFPPEQKTLTRTRTSVSTLAAASSRLRDACSRLDARRRELSCPTSASAKISCAASSLGSWQAGESGGHIGAILGVGIIHGLFGTSTTTPAALLAPTEPTDSTLSQRMLRIGDERGVTATIGPSLWYWLWWVCRVIEGGDMTGESAAVGRGGDRATDRAIESRGRSKENMPILLSVEKPATGTLHQSLATGVVVHSIVIDPVWWMVSSDV